ncbi:MAG: hypothetical protein AABX83_02220 [Nanoarchaeota archaeon]
MQNAKNDKLEERSYTANEVVEFARLHAKVNSLKAIYKEERLSRTEREDIGRVLGSYVIDYIRNVPEEVRQGFNMGEVELLQRIATPSSSYPEFKDVLGKYIDKKEYVNPPKIFDLADLESGIIDHLNIDKIKHPPIDKFCIDNMILK